jgi:hypothetical protein
LTPPPGSAFIAPDEWGMRVIGYYSYCRRHHISSDLQNRWCNMASDDRYNWKDFQPGRRDVAAALVVMFGAALLLGVAGNWLPAGGNGHAGLEYRYLPRAALPHEADVDEETGNSGPEDSPGVYKAPQD